VAAVGASWFFSESGFVRDTSRTWWNGLILAFLVYTIAQVTSAGEGYIRAGLRFILVLTSIKFFIRDGARDELQIYALSFLIIAAATAVNEGVTYGIFFGVYVLSGTFSLALFHLKEELANRETVPLIRRIPFDRRYMAVLAGLSVMIFVSSVGIFFGFPRIGLGYFAQQSRGGTSVSGFSDSVELGSHGAVRTNPSIALRVEFPEGRPLNFRQFHWRTLTFDYYDGSSWSRTFDDTDRELPDRDDVYELSDIYPSRERLAQRPHDEIPETIRIYAEPLGSDVLPVLWPTRTVEFEAAEDRHMPGNPRTGDVEIDAYGDVSHNVPSQVGLSYTITTYGRPDAERLAELDGEVTRLRRAEAYLQLPESLDDRVARLARRVTEGADTPYRKAEAVESHLRNNYEYTTDLPKVDPDHPIRDFLFEFQRGHCEYYATAMVLMLRTIGVHARMTNGFLGGRWNRFGNFLAVRQADAHSWVEVYIPRYGWVQMDPTPAGSPNLYTNAATVWFRDAYDTLRMQWMKWVIEYDLRSQIDLLRRLSQYLVPRGLMSDSDDSERGDSSRGDSDERGVSIGWRSAIFWFGWLALALASFLASRRFDPRFRRVALGSLALASAAASSAWAVGFQSPAFGWGLAGAVLGFASVTAGALTHLLAATRNRLPVSQLFERIEVAGRRSGTPRRPGETPGDYLERLAEAHPEASRDLEQFRRRYLAIRFGGRDVSPEMHARLRETVKDITRAIDD
jgi:transglutaminase-like putative cysteine protease